MKDMKELKKKLHVLHVLHVLHELHGDLSFFLIHIFLSSFFPLMGSLMRKQDPLGLESTSIWPL